MSFINKIIGKSIKATGLGKLLGAKRAQVRNSYQLGEVGGAVYAKNNTKRKKK